MTYIQPVSKFFLNNVYGIVTMHPLLYFICPHSMLGLFMPSTGIVFTSRLLTSYRLSKPFSIFQWYKLRHLSALISSHQNEDPLNVFALRSHDNLSYRLHGMGICTGNRYLEQEQVEIDFRYETFTLTETSFSTKGSIQIVRQRVLYYISPSPLCTPISNYQ